MTQVIKARPTLYKGVQMRSRLEADYAAFLDRNDSYSWEYEPECFAGPDGQWLPDFHETGNGRDAWIEVKPASLLERQPGVDRIAKVDKILAQMSVAWLSKPDAWLELVFWEYGAERVPLTLIAEMGDAVAPARAGNLRANAAVARYRRVRQPRSPLGSVGRVAESGRIGDAVTRPDCHPSRAEAS